MNTHRRRIGTCLFAVSILVLVCAPQGFGAPGNRPDRSRPLHPPDPIDPGAELVVWEPAPGPSGGPDAVPSALGGPDDFGYTWDDSVPFSWIDATGGTNTGLTGRNQQVGPISLPFTFKFYEQSYDAIYISTNGTVGFSGGLTADSQEWIFPLPSQPNNVIAPYWAPEDAATGGVYYTSGGTAPNRWWVVEWYEVRDVEPDSRLTFEAVLFESGDIEFRYQTMNFGAGSYWAYGVGIEDSLGVDGLEYYARPSAGLAVRFARPAAAPRVGLAPRYGGSLTYPGATQYLDQLVRNTGDTGQDTYEVFTTTNWLLNVYHADGVTPLADTDGDLIVDTGPIAQGEMENLVLALTTPAEATLGDSNQALLAARSSLDPGKIVTATTTTAIPAPFAQIFQDEFGTQRLYLAQPYGQLVKDASYTGSYGYSPAISETPDGFVGLWYRYRLNPGNVSVCEIEFRLFDHFGEPVTPVRRLADLSGATLTTYDQRPAVAVAPDGTVGAAWLRYVVDPASSELNYNIFFAILDPSGALLYGPASVTDNDQWGGWGDLGWFYFADARIAATEDSRFVLAWSRRHEDVGGTVIDVYYTIRGTGGQVIQPVTPLTADTPGWDHAYQYPALAKLAGNRVLVAWQHYQSGNTSLDYAVLDSAGTVIKAPAVLASGSLYSPYPDAAQLAGGPILVAWSGYPPAKPGETPWSARYYNNETLTEPAALVRTDQAIDFQWNDGSPDPAVNPDHFSVRWTGTINVAAGLYQFTMGSDDGSRLWIDGELVMDYWNECCQYWYTAVSLGNGPHEVIMEMREIDGAAWAYLSWRSSIESVIYYALLDGATYELDGGPWELDNPAARVGGYYASVAQDAAGHGILTWTDLLYDRLYYALVATDGQLLTPPTPFLTGDPQTVYSGYSGYGNTSYSWIPPEGVDGLASATNSLFAGPAGGLATVHPRFANHGATLATGVVFTATLAPELVYVGDTLGITPTLVANAVAWNLSDLHCLAEDQFALSVQLPAGVGLGTRYPVTLTLTSDGPEANPEDNITWVEVMVAEQVFLPTILQSR